MSTLFAAFVGHMSGADFFGLSSPCSSAAYLLYALLRGEKL